MVMPAGTPASLLSTLSESEFAELKNEQNFENSKIL
jgi:hypothetical protein